MKGLAGKAAIVTGASRGIGRAIAARLAGERVLVTGVARDIRALEELAGESERIRVRACDVANEGDVRAAVAEHVAACGRLDILVNNAGIGVFGPIEETTYEDFRRVIEVNAGGTFLFMREALPHMKARGDGDIINIASVVGLKGYLDQCAYGASKHAVVGLTKAVAAEAHGHGVRVRSICPGGVDTDLIAAARPDLDPNVLIRPQDIADIVWFLLAMPGSAVIDTVNVRRRGSEPWF